MERIIIGILIINIIASLVYAVSTVSKGQKAALTFFFCTLPLLGFCIYFIPQWILRIQGKGYYDRDTLVKRLEIEKERIMPSVKKELDIIPVEDAMAVSNNNEKRKLLLDQLKKDINVNYKVILPAGSDSDSESAHYVAAARMEVCRRKQIALAASKEEWQKESDNQQKLRNYLSELQNYIESELLDDKEADVYKEEYCNIMKQIIERQNSIVTAGEYSCYITYLVDLKQYTDAESCWGKISPDDKNEKAYQVMLQMYYDLKNEKMFYKYLEDLKKSNINFSSDGLKLVRYWMGRRTY